MERKYQVREYIEDEHIDFQYNLSIEYEPMTIEEVKTYLTKFIGCMSDDWNHVNKRIKRIKETGCFEFEFDCFCDRDVDVIKINKI